MNIRISRMAHWTGASLFVLLGLAVMGAGTLPPLLHVRFDWADAASFRLSAVALAVVALAFVGSLLGISMHRVATIVGTVLETSKRRIIAFFGTLSKIGKRSTDDKRRPGTEVYVVYVDKDEVREATIPVNRKGDLTLTGVRLVRRSPLSKPLVGQSLSRLLSRED